MSGMHHSLLGDGVFRVRDSSGNVTGLSLPAILAALVEDEVHAFEALQFHQQQPWLSFLVQLAAMAVARENGGEIPERADGWRRMLVGLAEGEEAAWHLVVDEFGDPAFMQSPVPEGSLEEAKYREVVPTPDALDLLVTSKNHDVKTQRIARPDVEHWIFALISLQTMEGFLGRGNYGIIRMNGGFGNRPMVGLVRELGWGKRFLRDLRVLLEARDAFFDARDESGEALLWLQPWDGEKSSAVPLQQCDPYFIEICRRLRFTSREGRLLCWRANTKGQRIAASDELHGVTGDPWTPVEKKGAKALTVGASGFHYDLLQQLLLGDEYEKPPALQFQREETTGAFFIARTLVRGQGKTDGLHQRIIPVPPNVSRILTGRKAGRERLAARSRDRVSLAGRVMRRVLRPAVVALVGDGRTTGVPWEMTRQWTDAFDREVDARFFDELWESAEADEEEAQNRWEEVLLDLAQDQLREAERSTAISTLHRWRAVSRARAIFESRAREVLPGGLERRYQSSKPTEEEPVERSA